MLSCSVVFSSLLEGAKFRTFDSIGKNGRLFFSVKCKTLPL